MRSEQADPVEVNKRMCIFRSDKMADYALAYKRGSALALQRSVLEKTVPNV